MHALLFMLKHIFFTLPLSSSLSLRRALDFLFAVCVDDFKKLPYMDVLEDRRFEGR